MRNDDKTTPAKKLTLKKETLRDLRIKTGIKTGLAATSLCTRQTQQTSMNYSCNATTA